MGFRETLEQICRQVDGALAASVMGYDGIAVDTHEVDPAKVKTPSEVNLGSTMVEYSSIFGQIRTAAAQLQAGEASEFSIRTEKIVAVGRSVTSEYFVVVALSPDGNLGKARYALRVGAGQIAADLL
jgi:predicted regulator of Ras-like GTPase activity (Roadblock/LC7/MglB family)